MSDVKAEKKRTVWKVAKTISRMIFTLIFGLTQRGCTAANESLWQRTQVPAAQLNGLTPLESHAASSRIHCAAASLLNSKSHLMAYNEGTCTLYDLRYPEIQSVTAGTESVVCYTDKKGCMYNGKFYDEDEIIETDCETLICKDNEVVAQSGVAPTQGDGTCTSPFFVVDGIGCVMIVSNMTMIQCKAKKFCSSLGAQLLLSSNATVTKMTDFVYNTSIFTKAYLYWVGVEDGKWVDGTTIHNEIFYRDTNSGAGACAFTYAGYTCSGCDNGIVLTSCTTGCYTICHKVLQ